MKLFSPPTVFQDPHPSTVHREPLDQAGRLDSTCVLRYSISLTLIAAIVLVTRSMQSLALASIPFNGPSFFEQVLKAACADRKEGEKGDDARKSQHQTTQVWYPWGVQRAYSDTPNIFQKNTSYEYTKTCCRCYHGESIARNRGKKQNAVKLYGKETKRMCAVAGYTGQKTSGC